MDTNDRAVASMAAAGLFFFGMSVSVRLAEGIPTLQVVFFRALIALVLCLVQLRMAGLSPLGSNHRLLLLRGVFGTGALIAYFSSLLSLPLATATVLQNLSPIFTTLVAVLARGERWRPVQAAFIGLAFFGVIVVNGWSAETRWGPVAVGVVGAMMSAIAYNAIAAIGEREHPLVIILWFPLVTIPLVGPLLPAVWVWPSPWQWGALLGVGLFVQVAQYFMTRAYQLGEAGVVSVVGYLGVLWAMLGGWALFGEPVSVGMIAGAALVLAGVAGNTWAKRAAR